MTSLTKIPTRAIKAAVMHPAPQSEASAPDANQIARMMGLVLVLILVGGMMAQLL